ncbi:MAG TPA: hypothetical protein PKW21_05085 [Rhabdaerophilum sp.]|nr:hypothetical protein [Rhabdaerophilum sp.]
MAGALIFSLAMATIGLLVFGERMGLPAGLAAFGVAGVLGAVLAASAIVSATSRLGNFVIGEKKGATVSFAGISALLLILGQFHLMTRGHEVLPAFLWLTAGFVASQFFLPVNPWSSFCPASEVGPAAGLAPGESLRGSVAVVMLATSLGAVVLLATLLPTLADRLVEASGWPFQIVFRTMLGLVCALALVGGLVSVRRATMVCLAFAALLFILPVMPEWLRAGLPDVLDADAIRLLSTDVVSRIRIRGEGVLPALDSGAAIAGFLIGLAALQPSGAVFAIPARLVATVTAGVLAATIAAFIEFNGMRMQSLATGLAEAPPAQWPVFVYDDVLRGWLSACGSWPDDARQAVRACGAVDLRVPLPAGALRFDNGLAMPALAASTGLPVILGFLWALLPLTLVLTACGLLLLVVATGCAEVLFGRLSALRSARLARVRLAILGVSLLALIAGEIGYRPDARHVRWLMLGTSFLGLAAMMAGWLIRFIRAVRNRRRAQISDEGEVQSRAC